MKCLMFDIEMLIGEVCPSPYNKDGFKCQEYCGCADNPELINEKAKIREELEILASKILKKQKKGELERKKDGFMELEKIGTRTPLGTYIIEGNLAYIEQEEEGKVTVVTASGIRETVLINELEKFIKVHDIHDDVREELEILASKILKK